MKMRKRSIFFIIFGILLLIAIVFFFSQRQDAAPQYSSVFVEEKTLVQSVSETGAVDTTLSVSAGWEVSGQVVDIQKQVGDSVVRGDVIATLDATQQQARLSEVFSQLSAAQARLDLESAGPSNEDKQQAQTAIDQANALLLQIRAEVLKTQAQAQERMANAQKAVADAENNLRFAEGGDDSQLVTDAYEDLVNTLKIVLTSLKNGLTEADSILGVDNSFANDDFSQALGFRGRSKIDIAERSYDIAKLSLNDVSSDILSLTSFSDQATIDETVIAAASALVDMQQLLYDVQILLSFTDPVGGLTQTGLNTLIDGVATVVASVNTAAASLSDDRQAIVTARNSLSSYQIEYDKALSNLETARQQSDADLAIAQARVVSQEAAVAQAQSAYAVLVAPPRSVDLASLRADVARYQASVQAQRDAVDQTVLRALSDGVISSLSIEIGENVTANQDVLTIISPELSIEVDISESDIAAVEIGDSVGITLDAFGDDVLFEGTVVQIEPAQTEVSGVIYYKTDIVFVGDTPTDAIRPGMTANITIYTDEVAQALVIPQRALFRDGDEQYVRILMNDAPFRYERRVVTTGLRGDDGEIHVTSGLSVGDEVITFLDEE